ncbi:MAG: metallophosphoesterase [Leptospiraceae bacterium]|nr:metallophosphoesterase [Leptospiraceae bacterium]
MLQIRLKFIVPLICLSQIFCSVSGVYVRSDQIDETRQTGAELQSSQRLILIGDAGKAENEQPLWQVLRKTVAENPGNTRVIYLGDNLYEAGLPAPAENDPDYEKYAGVLQTQIDAAAGARQIIFVPGNHDWANRKEIGKTRILAQQSYVKAQQAEFFPANGCPDVHALHLNENNLALFLDSQAITDLLANRTFDSTNCENKTVEQLSKQLARLTAGFRAENKTVMILAHHPLRTIGPHGGYFSWHHHVFPVYNYNPYVPLPIVASMIVWGRQLGWLTSTDISHKDYQRYIEFVDQIIKGLPNVIIAAGHDHNIQILQSNKADGLLHIVSGTGSKSDIVFEHDDSLLATTEPGMIIMDFLPNGKHAIKLRLADGRDF